MPDRLHRLGLLLLVGLTVLLLITNHVGHDGPGRIQAWWAEYEGGGSCAWRQAPGAATWLSFHEWIVGLTLVCYPLGALVGLFSGVRLLRGSGDRRSEAVGLVLALGCLGIYLWLGLAQAAFELC